MLDIREGEKRAVFGGHVRRSRENVIAEKKGKNGAESGTALFLPRAHSRIDGKRVRKQFSECSCLASETAFVARRRPRHVRAPLLFSLFVLLKKASTRVHQRNSRRKSTLRRACIPHSPILRASTSKSATWLANVTKIAKNGFFFFLWAQLFSQFDIKTVNPK